MNTPASSGKCPRADIVKVETLDINLESIVVALPKKRAYARCRPAVLAGDCRVVPTNQIPKMFLFSTIFLKRESVGPVG